MPETLADGEQYYTVGEVAGLLRVGPATIRKRLKDGVYPGAIKPGKSWLIPESQLMNALNKRFGHSLNGGN